MESALEDPYRLIYEEDTSVDASGDGYALYDFSWQNKFPIDILDYQAGEFQLQYELSFSFSGLDQTYIGKVFENPPRYLFGSYCFEREGFTEGGSREKFEYEFTRLVWQSQIYRLSANQASRPKTLQLGALPIWEQLPRQVIPLQTYGQIEPVPLVARSNANAEEAWAGTIYTGGDPIYQWTTETDAEIIIGKRFPVIPTAPLETSIAAEQLRLKLDKAELLLNEKLGLYSNAIDLGTIELYRERSKVFLTLYQGISADITFKIYQCGLYRTLNPLPTYPVPPPGGGGGGGV